MTQKTLTQFEQPTKRTARQIIAHATSQGQVLGGLAHGNESKSLSIAVKEALRARGYNVTSVRASTRSGHRGIKVVIPQGDRDYLAWLEQVLEPVHAYLDSVIGDELPAAVDYR